MGHLKQLVTLLALLGIFRASAQEIQDLDDVKGYTKVVLECDKGSIINRIRSYFDGTDRKWSFGCSKGPGIFKNQIMNVVIPSNGSRSRSM